MLPSLNIETEFGETQAAKANWPWAVESLDDRACLCVAGLFWRVL